MAFGACLVRPDREGRLPTAVEAEPHRKPRPINAFAETTNRAVAAFCRRMPLRLGARCPADQAKLETGWQPCVRPAESWSRSRQRCASIRPDSHAHSTRGPSSQSPHTPSLRSRFQSAPSPVPADSAKRQRCAVAVTGCGRSAPAACEKACNSKSATSFAPISSRACDQVPFAWTIQVSGSGRPGFAELRAAHATSPGVRITDGKPSRRRSNTNMPVQHGCDRAISAVRVMEKSCSERIVAACSAGIARITASNGPASPLWLINHHLRFR